uniref:Uncharacterized protein n=1 Tax=Oncorhynchus mykiss TaxID=8022 RepID=A0A8C7T8R7_ONCMY
MPVNCTAASIRHTVAADRRFLSAVSRICPMNPGRFGMAQARVPVGKVNHVHDWLKITGEVGHPPSEHPKRRIKGMACIQREAVSKAKLEEQGVLSLLST